MPPLSFKNLPLKRKWQLIFLGIFLLFLIAYKYNISKTISLMVTYHSLSTNASSVQNIQYDILPKNKRSLPNHSYSGFLDSIDYCCSQNKVILKEIRQSYPPLDSGKFKLQSNKLTLEGTFQNIEQTIYAIERRNITPINATTVELVQNKDINTYTVIATLYINRLENEKENK